MIRLITGKKGWLVKKSFYFGTAVTLPVSMSSTLSLVKDVTPKSLETKLVPSPARYDVLFPPSYAEGENFLKLFSLD